MRARVPRIMKGTAVHGTELMLLDNDLAGMVHLFMRTGDKAAFNAAYMQLNPQSEKSGFDLLKALSHELARILPELYSEEAAYFRSLSEAAETILREGETER